MNRRTAAVLGFSPSFVGCIIAACAAVWVTSAASTVLAAGVVGTGTAASCSDAALNAALAGGGLVTFNCGGPATIDISTGTGSKTISSDTTIDGGGLVTISGGNQVTVFSVNNPAVTFAVENLTIANGHDAGFGLIGGGIFNSGTLTITNSTFSGNSGAGIANVGIGGTVTVTNCTFTGNSGGIVSSEGPLTVTDCTFSGNSGGGISNDAGTLTVTNSTFSGNSAGDTSGGGIANTRDGTLTIINSTVTGNSGAGGIVNFATAVLRNTILANNTPNCVNLGAITDGGHNLDDGTSCGFSTATGSLSDADPQLDPAGLQDNGGPTHTVALCTAAGIPAGCGAASPAVDAGDQAVCDAEPVSGLDQRGLVRPGTGHTQCSIGAYEADAGEACTGDCNGNGMVAINELILGVNIVLGTQPVDTCPGFASSDGMVDIAQLIKGVGSTLNGCG